MSLQEACSVMELLQQHAQAGVLLLAPVFERDPASLQERAQRLYVVGQLILLDGLEVGRGRFFRGRVLIALHLLRLCCGSVQPVPDELYLPILLDLCGGKLAPLRQAAPAEERQRFGHDVQSHVVRAVHARNARIGGGGQVLHNHEIRILAEVDHSWFQELFGRDVELLFETTHCGGESSILEAVFGHVTGLLLLGNEHVTPASTPILHELLLLNENEVLVAELNEDRLHNPLKLSCVRVRL
mmetsp:Transcript_19351/g.42225  ORF Transcript_19351/g.42225 Transcript_19351/m.42225 type:complete len:242 (+) Transcript_19351:702-1427(+)